MNAVEQTGEPRRRFLAYFAGVGLSTTLMPGALWAQMQAGETDKVTLAMVEAAEKIAGLEFTTEERKMLLDGVNQNHERILRLRKIALPNSVPTCLRFSPVVPGMKFDMAKRRMKTSKAPVVKRPANLEDVAFWPVTRLAALIRTRQVSSEELTQMYIARLKRYDSQLHFVITYTDDLALKQAKQADAEIAAGRYRGLLHGIPWGSKDLIARKGYKTTWGAAPYKDQSFDYDATVMERLDAAGAVLIAKLTTGELAAGDVWFGGQTMNPWNPKEGSSGSSAGPASATAAGCVGFAVGTETGGSIVGPSTRCGVYGLRSSFGRVSCHGVMTLAWSRDRVGPLCRSVEDCAIVLNALHGPDGLDLTVTDVPFNWDAGLDLRTLRVGYLKAAFDEPRSPEETANDAATLEKLRSMGVALTPIELPGFPIADLLPIVQVELAAAFDELTLSNRDDLLAKQGPGSDANLYRVERFVPAVEFIQASRVRTLLMEAMAKTMSNIDVYVAPLISARAARGAAASSAQSAIRLNTSMHAMTGHPAIVVRNGFGPEGWPTSMLFTGQVYGEAKMLRLAHAYQEATKWHEKHPVLA